MNISNYKLALAAFLSSISISLYNNEYVYEPEYVILDETDGAYGKYSDGLVYIGNKSYINEINEFNDGDILINENGKYVRILSSYKVIDKDKRNEILCILKDYEINHNSKNIRSIESMRMEWFIHNLLYEYDFQIERTRDVDFENWEEYLYKNKILSRILKI